MLLERALDARGDQLGGQIARAGHDDGDVFALEAHADAALYASKAQRRGVVAPSPVARTA